MSFFSLTVDVETEWNLKAIIRKAGLNHLGRCRNRMEFKEQRSNRHVKQHVVDVETEWNLKQKVKYGMWQYTS